MEALTSHPPHISPLLELLSHYKPCDWEESICKARFHDFVSNEPSCFERELLSGHLTASSWLIDSTGKRVLLTHHQKLDCWIQLGGHADGERDLLAVALREATEESGISKIEFVSKEIFDLDIHTIPEYRGIPEHLHYDVCFLMRVVDSDEFVVSSESKELKWVAFDEVKNYSAEKRILRLVKKSRGL